VNRAPEADALVAQLRIRLTCGGGDPGADEFIARLSASSTEIRGIRRCLA
jgi:hypothetical protein